MADELGTGLYDNLVDGALSDRLAELGDQLHAALNEVDPADVPNLVAQTVQRWVERSLKDVRDEDRLSIGLKISQELLATIGKAIPDSVLDGDALSSPLQRLIAIQSVVAEKPIPIPRPLTPLRDTVLMTNARGEPGVGREILAEIASADRVDLLCAFIRWTGIRELLPALTRHVQSGKELRIITTVYTGSTEQRALEMLRSIGGQVKVSYDTSTTRLHAKAWMFHRESGHSTVYIGSSNLTFSAQVTGLEWNVRAAQNNNPDLIKKFEATFLTYWANPQFEDFDPDRFQQATTSSTPSGITLTPFDIQPFPFQRQILENLQVDRQRGFPNNLVVAATGTGKTVMAALDYRNLREQSPPAKLLYVAHRREILEQSQAMFRHVMRDGAFGELWFAGRQPVAWDHVFASIQTLHASDVSNLRPDQFDIVIVDEFHHAAAASYERLLNHLQPRHLLGLTATPERSDNLDILRWFGNRISVELRLWDALEQELLAPFHYFGIHDGTDLRKVTWRRGSGYDGSELTKIYTAENFWAGKIIQAVSEKIGVPVKMRALGFCVSIGHAQFMAEQFSLARLAARAITSDSTEGERAEALSLLQKGEIQAIFAVDLFNEGVDIPEIDVVLMLRPTESATLFLQQLGRGLRRFSGKDVLTVLDFVGHQRKEFRFDLRYRRMLGRTRTELLSDVEEGFPYLPAGCHLELDPVAARIVIDNLRNALPTTWPQRIAELRAQGDVLVKSYLEETGLDIEDIYRSNHYWTDLRRAAGHIDSETPEGEAKAGRGVGRLLHVDDNERLGFLQKILSDDHPPTAEQLDERNRRQLHMSLLTILNPSRGDFETLPEALDALWGYPGLRSELLQVVEILEDRIVHLHQPLSIPGPVPVPLQVHAHYRLEEIVAAFGAASVVTPQRPQAGVYWHRDSQTDIFFVTLKKSAKDFSPRTRYDDFAISETLFHWESQAATTVEGPTGQRYLNHREQGSRVLLFVRPTKTDATNRTLPYFCAGLANYVSHKSERPIAITWELKTPLPGDLFAAYRAAVA